MWEFCCWFLLGKEFSQEARKTDVDRAWRIHLIILSFPAMFTQLNVYILCAIFNAHQGAVNGNKGFVHAGGPRLCSWLVVGQGVIFQGSNWFGKKKCNCRSAETICQVLCVLVNSFDNWKKILQCFIQGFQIKISRIFKKKMLNSVF